MGCPRRAGFARLGRVQIVFRVWPHPTRYYGYSDLHCVTFKLLSPSAVGGRATLEAVRRQYRFVVLGYVVMPEHVHLLVSEPERRSSISFVTNGWSRRASQLSFRLPR